VADDWTLHLRRYIAELRAARLMPPINAIEVGRRRGRAVLWIDVVDAPTDDLSARVRAVLGSVPHQIRHVPLSSDGRRRGVDYA
jgi:hypothetical protein